MRRNWLFVTTVVLLLSLTFVREYQISKLERKVEDFTVNIEELREELMEVEEEALAQVLELEAKLKSAEDTISEQIGEILRLQKELDAKQELEDSLVSIIMKEGHPKPTEEFARKLSKLVIVISKEYEEVYGFENDIPRLMSIIRVESQFNPNSTSYAGAKGLMQLMDATGKAYAEKLGFNQYKPYDPEQNIRVAWYYYNVNKEKLGENKATVAYNQGYRNLDNAVNKSLSNRGSYLNKVNSYTSKYSRDLSSDK